MKVDIKSRDFWLPILIAVLLGAAIGLISNLLNFNEREGATFLGIGMGILIAWGLPYAMGLRWKLVERDGSEIKKK